MHQLILGGTRDQRLRIARAAGVNTPILTLDAATLPFITPALPDPRPRTIRLDDIEQAFPDHQTGGTRLVLTQSTYLMQKWIDLLDDEEQIIATADRESLTRCAPEFAQGRGAWSALRIIDVIDVKNTKGTADTKDNPPALPSVSVVPSVSLARERQLASELARAFEASAPAERLRLCQDATTRESSSAIAWLCSASAHRETRDGTAARAALDRALTLAPEWEAAHYESAKLSLVYDDMERARDAFQRAADLMPTFSAAFSNLGATLGELDDPAAALRAFRQALAHDPRSFTILNNIGVVCRELGRLDESDTALRKVIAINPAFVFGHYNLGHTLFLGGKFAEALAAYKGQRRDPAQNRRQGCRLAVIRLANGDPAGAERDLWRFANGATPEEREALLLEAYEITHALIARHPGLSAHQPFLDRIGAEIAKSE